MHSKHLKQQDHHPTLRGMLQRPPLLTALLAVLAGITGCQSAFDSASGLCQIIETGGERSEPAPQPTAAHRRIMPTNQSWINV